MTRGPIGSKTISKPVLSVLAVLPLAIAPSCHAPAHPRGPAPEVQLNLSGNETAGALLNKEYVLPTEETLDYYARKGFVTFRLPMNWNRLQPEVGGPLVEAKLKEIDDFLKRADAKHLRVIPDLHEYGRKNGHALGSPELPTSALASFWGQFAKRYAGRFAGYDLMNEPHDMPSAKAWPEAAQLAVDAIRKVDRKTTIYVEGDDWSSANRWQRSNPDLNIKDPAHRLIYSAHIYFDNNTSGQYKTPYALDGATPAIGPTRLQPFVDWLRARKLKGHIGEYGVPKDDPRWLAVLDAFLNAVRDNGDVLTGSAYWTGGDWLDRYDLSVQPARDGKWADRPQLKVLLKHRRDQVAKPTH